MRDNCLQVRGYGVLTVIASMSGKPGLRPLRRNVAGVVIGIGSAFAALAPPAFAPQLFLHSSYLFGMVAVLCCAAFWGALSTLAAAVLVTGGAIFLELRTEMSAQEIVTRALLFLSIAALSIAAARAIMRYRRASESTLADLAQQQAVLRSMLDTGPDAMLVIDRAGLVANFSPAAEQLFGWRADEVIGRNVSMLMPSPYQLEHDSYIQRYLESGERQIIGKSREVKGLRKDGTHFPMMLHVGEVRLGEDRQFTGFVHDLTALHAAHDRTQDLRAQLTHIWSMNSLGEMAAVLAHELNQPLAAIANYVRGARTMIAGMPSPDPELLEAVDQAGNQAIRAGEIIRRIRSLISRNEAELKPESLAAIISEIDFMISLAARDAGVTVRYQLAEGPDLVHVDRIQIQQVVSNLARNAAEAMVGSRQKVLEIRTVRSGPNWIVSVEDSGPGIASEISAKLFAPLASGKPHGMGLGLSVSRAIVEFHRGEIWVDRSRLGGAAFCFSLPATQDLGSGLVSGTNNLRHR